MKELLCLRVRKVVFIQPCLCTGLLGGVQVYTGLTHLAVLAQMYQMPDSLEFLKNFRKYCQLTLCFGMGNNASHIN